MSNFIRDARGGIRRLTKNPGFTAMVVLTHALGIGVTAAVFSIFNSVLLAPLPYPNPKELVAVYDTQPACDTCPASFPKYHDWRERNQVFAAIGGSSPKSFVLTGDGDPARIRGVGTTASFANVFDVPPQMGRWYTEAEDQPGGPKVAVLSHDFWASRLNADPAALGRKLILDGEPYEVIGVMPDTFAHRRGELFVPLQLKLDPAARGSHFLATYARLKKDVTVERAAAEMRALGAVLAREFGTKHGIDVRSYTEVVVGEVRTPLYVLLGAVLFILLIGSANVANLLLASGLARRTELAIRMALGAGPRALARQLAAESVVLAVIGGAVGVLLAEWALGAFVFLAGDDLPRASTIAIDGRVLLFAAGVSVAVGILCSLWPIFLVCRQDLASAVREGDSRTQVGAGKKIGNGLAVAEIAIAFGLLVSAGLLVKNLILLQDRDTGFRTERIVAFDVGLSGPRYGADELVVSFFRELYTRLSQVGDVESVGMTSHLPMDSYGYNGEFSVEGGNPWGPNDAPLVEYRWIYGDYLKTMGVPLLSGRLLGERDSKGTRTVLINRATAEKFWPGKDAIGRHFGQGTDTSQWYEVVGVIGNMRSYGLTRDNPYEFYRTIEQSAFPAMTVVIRARGGNPLDVVPTARRMVTSIDPAVPITQVQTLEQVVADSVGRPRLMAALTGLFGALGGLLAMVGVFSVMNYNVRRQRREFGIRMAVGARPADVVRMVVSRGIGLAGLGVAIGALGAWMLTRVLKTILYDVKPTDNTVFAGVAAAVLLVALLASYFPARSAGRVDPNVVLRYE